MPASFSSKIRFLDRLNIIGDCINPLDEIINIGCCFNLLLTFGVLGEIKSNKCCYNHHFKCNRTVTMFQTNVIFCRNYKQKNV